MADNMSELIQDANRLLKGRKRLLQEINNMQLQSSVPAIKPDEAPQVAKQELQARFDKLQNFLRNQEPVKKLLQPLITTLNQLQSSSNNQKVTELLEQKGELQRRLYQANLKAEDNSDRLKAELRRLQEDNQRLRKERDGFKGMSARLTQKMSSVVQKVKNMQEQLKSQQVKIKEMKQNAYYQKIAFQNWLQEAKKQYYVTSNRVEVAKGKEREDSVRQAKVKFQKQDHQLLRKAAVCRQIQELTGFRLKAESNESFEVMQRALSDYRKSQRFLVDSVIAQMRDQRSWLISQLEKVRGSFSRISSKFVYRYDVFNPTNFHKYFDGKPNLLVLIKLQNGNVLGGYTKYPFDREKNERPGCAFIFSLSLQAAFYQKPEASGPVIIYDDFYIIFGNSEIRLRTHQLKIMSNFGTTSSVFNSRNRPIEDFLGASEKELPIETIEMHQLSFSE